jgi:hypothetical protein
MFLVSNTVRCNIPLKNSFFMGFFLPRAFCHLFPWFTENLNIDRAKRMDNRDIFVCREEYIREKALKREYVSL